MWCLRESTRSLFGCLSIALVLLVSVTACAEEPTAPQEPSANEGPYYWERADRPLPSLKPTRESDFVGQWRGYLRELTLAADGTGSVGIQKSGAKLPDGRIIGERWSLRWFHNENSIQVTFLRRTELVGDGSSGIIEENVPYAGRLATDLSGATFMLMSRSVHPALHWTWCRPTAMTLCVP